MISRTIHILTLLGALFVVLGCGGDTYEVQATDRAPGGDVTIEVNEADEHNLKVHVVIKHLPPSERLESGKDHYILWLIPSGQSAQNAGALRYDEDDREGELEVITPHRKFKVLVTIEKGHTPSHPSEDVIASKNVGM